MHLLRNAAQTRPERQAYTFLKDGEVEEGCLRVGDLEIRARALGAALQDLEAAGERVLLLYPPGLDFIAAFFGCLYAGAVAVPAYPPGAGRSQPRLRAIAGDARPAVVLAPGAMAARRERIVEQVPELKQVRWLAGDAVDSGMAGLWREISPGAEALAFLQYTSGSTADPKGVMVSHGNLLHNEEMIRRAFAQSEQSVIVGWLPLYHDMGLIGNVLQPLYAGAPCILMSPAAFLQQPARWLRAVSRYRATTSGGPNFAYDLCVRKVGPEVRAELDLSSWTVAFNGAEPVREETLARFAEAFAPCGFRRAAFYPCYGLAEATLFVSGGAVDQEPRIGAAPDSGHPLTGCGHAWMEQRIAIADPESGAERPAGNVGEIWVAGPSVACGYWGRPEETARDFGARLAGREAEGAFLRTGDLGFVRDGELFVSGRLKDLIILRGRNLYPQDVERTAEGSHPALRPGCVAAFGVEMGGEERLVVVGEQERGDAAPAGEVAAAVRGAVGQEHEARVHEVVLLRRGTLPKTSSGKIQRRLCRSLYLAEELEIVGRSASISGETAESLPAGLSREALAALPFAERRAAIESWLVRYTARRGLAGVRPDRPLVESGLDSLAAVELQHAVETGLGARLLVADLLSGTRLDALASAVAEQLAAAEEAPAPAIFNLEIEGDLPLSIGQRALWFIDRLAPESAAYNLAAAARVHGPFDATVLERALGALAARHPVLRTVLLTLEGQPRQRFVHTLPLDFVHEDAAGWSEEAMRGLLDAEAARPIPLEHGPPWRARLLSRGPDEHVFLLVFHHLIADFWTIAGLLGELAALYRQEAGGEVAELPRLTATYAGFVAWQAELLAGPRGEQLRSWWEQRLAGPLSTLELPADRPRPPVQTHRGGSVPLALDAETTEGLRGLTRTSGATLFMVLSGLFQTLLHRASGQEDILIGTPTSGRGPAAFARVAGYFVNPVVLRTGFSGEPGFAELLERLRPEVLAAYEHQDYPFALLAERLQPQRDPSRPPVFQVLFIFQKSHLPELERLAGFALGEEGHRMEWAGAGLESLRLGWRPAPFDLTLSMAESGDGLAGSLQFNADLFDAATAERLLGHLAVLARSAAAEPRKPVSELALLTGEEREQLIHGWNETALELPAERLVHRLIERQIEKTPEAPALDDGVTSLTYQELGRRAGELARHLRRLGLRPEGRVGVCLERSVDLVATLLGILKAGGAYVPLDPAYPRDRLRFIVEDAGIDLLVARKRQAGMFATTGVRIVPPDADHKALSTHRAADLPPPDLPDPLAYVIYTSGSTGRPKGVMVGHGQVANFFAAMDRRLGTEPGRWLAVTSVSFDISVLELLWTLSRGCEVILHRGDGPAPGELPAVSLTGMARPIDFSLFYFASDERQPAGRGRYRLLLEGAQRADQLGFAAVWTPERHFHAFGGLYPNPSVTGAAVAALTERISIRAGSVVLPLHDPIRVAEEWSVVDNLSNGRAGISFASGWNAADFVFAPENFARRKEVLREQIETFRKLWRGEAVRRRGGAGEVEVQILPRPVQPELPIWLTAAGSPETFRLAGELGTHVLTHLLGQSLRDLAERIAIYREAWRAAGHPGEGQVALMLHTFVGDDPRQVRETVRGPFTEYLATSLDLMQVLAPGQDLSGLAEADRRSLLDRAFDRYFETSGLFGTPESCLARVGELRRIGVDEIACLVDFGIDTDTVLASLGRLAELRDLSRAEPEPALPELPPESISSLILRRGITHLQCTPSAATAILLDPDGPAALARLEVMLVGGEALPAALAERLAGILLKAEARGELLNMYGPTETTIWSAVETVSGPVTIGRPIANTEIYLLDARLLPVSVGQPGELYIGGLGVVRGYHGRPELSAERFLPDPFAPRPGGRLYRTGDLARRLPDGRIVFLGRVDHQVKVRGHRIELGEIESVLASHPAVREAVVVAREEVPGDLASQRLVAYLIPALGMPFDGTAELALRATPQRIEQALDGQERSHLPNGLLIAHLGAEQTGGLYREVFDQEIYLRHGIALPDGACIFDVGANVGLFTLWAGARARNARIWAFEPISPTFRVLRANVELYGLDARVFEIGLSDREEEIDFTFYPRMAGLSGRFAQEDREVTRAIIERWLHDSKGRGQGLPDGGEIEAVVDEFLRSEIWRCRLRPLSALIREQGIEQIDLLKIDVERSEREVLAGIAEEDWPKIRQIVLEIHTRELLEEIRVLLAARGYEVAVDDFIPVGEGVDMVYMLYARRPEAAAPAALSVTELREWVARELPAFMVPAAFVVLPSFPLTPNGKVDRRSLPAPEALRPVLDRAYVEPESETQKAVARVWSELLRIDRIGIHDNFFEIGGNSLLLVETHGRLRQSLGRDVTLVDLMRHPTIESLARHLGQDGGETVRVHHEKAQDRGRSQRAGLERLARGRAARSRAGSGTGENG